MAQYSQPTLSNFRAEKGYYTTVEIAEMFHVTIPTVRNWIIKGWLVGEMREPVSPKAKTMRGRYRIFPQCIEDIERDKDAIIEETKRYWVGISVKRRKAK
jgi:hypothetical protein